MRSSTGVSPPIGERAISGRNSGWWVQSGVSRNVVVPSRSRSLSWQSAQPLTIFSTGIGWGRGGAGGAPGPALLSGASARCSRWQLAQRVFGWLKPNRNAAWTLPFRSRGGGVASRSRSCAAWSRTRETFVGPPQAASLAATWRAVSGLREAWWQARHALSRTETKAFTWQAWQFLERKACDFDSGPLDHGWSAWMWRLALAR